jgi:hypothetical protein
LEHWVEALALAIEETIRRFGEGADSSAFAQTQALEIVIERIEGELESRPKPDA